MKCDVCGNPATKGIVGVGAFCSSQCEEELARKQNDLRVRLLSEPPGSMPDELGLKEFEMFIYKLALHFLKEMPEEDRETLRKKNPSLLRVDELAVQIKNKVLGILGRRYVAWKKSVRMQDRYLYGSFYKLRQKLPRAKVAATLVEGMIILKPGRRMKRRRPSSRRR